jgi:hypothetical protein
MTAAWLAGRSASPDPPPLIIEQATLPSHLPAHLFHPKRPRRTRHHHLQSHRHATLSMNRSRMQPKSSQSAARAQRKAHPARAACAAQGAAGSIAANRRCSRRVSC